MTNFNSLSVNQDNSVETAGQGFKDIAELLKAMRSLDALRNFNFKALNLQVDRYDYTGFNAMALYSKVVARLEAAKLADQDASIMVLKTVAIALLRGNIRRDQIEKTSPNGAQEINKIISFWGIKTRRSARERLTLSPDSFTFARFLVLFPHLACQLVVTNGSKFAKLPGPELTIFPAQTHRLPAAMHHTGFSALIPNTLAVANFSRLLKASHLAFMTEFGRVINPNNNRTFAAEFEYQKNHVNDAMNNSMPDEVRLKYLIGFGLDLVVNINLMINVCNDAMKAMNENPVYGIGDFTVVGDRIKVVEDDELNKKLISDEEAYISKIKTHRSTLTTTTTTTATTSTAVTTGFNVFPSF